MILSAVVSIPRAGTNVVLFRYLVERGGREADNMPSWSIPCDSYDHACTVVNAFNNWQVLAKPA